MKEFFKRKKLDSKFARAGPGKTLSGPSSSSQSARQVAPPVAPRELPIVDGLAQRGIQIYTTSELAQKIRTPEIDDDFFRLTADDVKLMQQRYDEEKARNEMLKTREMRRREAEMKTPSTNVARLRFKLPNDHIIEASFSASETMSAIRGWLVETCMDKMELDLKTFDILMGLRPLKDTEFLKTVRELRLIPATTLTVVIKNV